MQLDHFCSHWWIKLPMKFFAPIMRYCVSFVQCSTNYLLYEEAVMACLIKAGLLDLRFIEVSHVMEQYRVLTLKEWHYGN